MGLINSKEFENYKNIYNEKIKFVNQPNYFFYLKTSTDKLLERIKKRGRDYEQEIDKEYLNCLGYYYDKFFEKKFMESESFVIETDFLNKQEVLEKCLGFLNKRIN